MLPLPRARLSASMTVVAGSTLVIGPLAWYQILLGRSPVIGTNDIWQLEEVVYLTLGLLIAGLLLAFAGITYRLLRMQSQMSSGGMPSLMMRLSSIMSKRGSVKVFALSALAYGLLFGVVSGTLIVQPWSRFSQAYGVTVPSAVPVVCCGPFGQMPQLVVYLTEQFSILLIPVNLALLFTVSWLVGLNAAIANYAYSNRTALVGTRWLAGLGAFVGLFTMCPTCAAFFFLTTGFGGAAALALRIPSLQGFIIALAIPILAILPVFTSRKLFACRCVVRTAASRNN